MSEVLEIAKVDPYNCSIEELEEEIKRLSYIKDEYYNLEQSVKIFINSIYGATASPYFVGYNMFIAEAVTLQGQNLIKYANEVIDEYFIKHWHNDKKLHDVLGLKRVNKIREKSVVVYNDTDSTYMTFKPLFDSCDFKGDDNDHIDFILKMKELRLEPYLKKKFEEYAKRFNTEDLQVLELEKISYSGLMVAKKKYILDLAWKDPGVRYNRREKIKPTGIEIVQGSTPKFARTALFSLLDILFEKGKSLDYSYIINKLREIKRNFVLQEPEDIAQTKSIGDYEKYILEDKKSLKLASKCPINVRAAGIYNHMLLNSKWRSKYNILRTSDKLKYYYSKGEYDVFGFIPGNYPYELALNVDHDLQFEKVVIEPFNRYLNAAGFKSVPGQLFFAKSLF
ncbi:MAG: DNA polymerase domain-containing protein [Nanoarchaeota archaeon]